MDPLSRPFPKHKRLKYSLCIKPPIIGRGFQIMGNKSPSETCAYAHSNHGFDCGTLARRFSTPAISKTIFHEDSTYLRNRLIGKYDYLSMCHFTHLLQTYIALIWRLSHCPPTHSPLTFRFSNSTWYLEAVNFRKPFQRAQVAHLSHEGFVA